MTSSSSCSPTAGSAGGRSVALRRGRCELLRSRLLIAESLAEVNGTLLFQPTTKTYERRYVRLPGRVVENLARHLETLTADENALVFASGRGTPLRNQNFRRSYWNPAVKRAGVPATITPHGLRHTCASLLVDQGADPVAVQEHLGHRDVATTLRIYRHLFADRSDQLTGALDALYATAESEVLKADREGRLIGWSSLVAVGPSGSPPPRQSALSEVGRATVFAGPLSTSDGTQTGPGDRLAPLDKRKAPLTCGDRAPPAGFEPAAHGLGNRCSIP